MSKMQVGIFALVLGMVMGSFGSALIRRWWRAWRADRAQKRVANWLVDTQAALGRADRRYDYSREGEVYAMHTSPQLGDTFTSCFVVNRDGVSGGVNVITIGGRRNEVADTVSGRLRSIAWETAKDVVGFDEYGRCPETNAARVVKAVLSNLDALNTANRAAVAGAYGPLIGHIQAQKRGENVGDEIVKWYENAKRFAREALTRRAEELANSA